MRILKRVAIAVILLFLLGNISAIAWRWGKPYVTHDPLAGFPRVFLWAWERPENLAFLDPKEAGVAVLAETIFLNRTDVAMAPRMQPIALPPGIATIGVVRIESRTDTLPEQAKHEIVRQILETASRSTVGIQIDFDARVSERQFYRTLLEDLRKKMPKNKVLSITALASWCLYDDWISDLPVDESVPMLFRLGVGKLETRNYLDSGKDFRAKKTRFSIGLSLDEPILNMPRGRRLYLFNAKPWTRSSVNEALRYARELQ
jgi:hypothetical protein